MIVFFKVISDFGVSRLFKELSGQYSRCSRIASFCRRDLKKKLGVLQRKSITQKMFWQCFGLNKLKNQFWKIKFQKKLTSIFQNWFFGLFKPKNFQKIFWVIDFHWSTSNVFFKSLRQKFAILEYLEYWPNSSLNKRDTPKSEITLKNTIKCRFFMIDRNFWLKNVFWWKIYVLTMFCQIFGQNWPSRPLSLGQFSSNTQFFKKWPKFKRNRGSTEISDKKIEEISAPKKTIFKKYISYIFFFTFWRMPGFVGAISALATTWFLISLIFNLIATTYVLSFV